MKKISKRLFATVLAVAMFAALSIGAFAGSNSFTKKITGYTCSGYLSANKYSASASLSGTENPGEPVILDPPASLDGAAYDSLGNKVGSLYSSGVVSCSASANWSGSAATYASCSYTYMGTFLRSIRANV